jgi:hypothetical protein
MRVCPFNHHHKGTVWYWLATSRWRLVAQWGGETFNACSPETVDVMGIKLDLNNAGG